VTDLLQGLAVLVVVFLLLIVLGIQVQITLLTRKVDQIVDKLNQMTK
jgi:hypothetical protein